MLVFINNKSNVVFYEDKNKLDVVFQKQSKNDVSLKTRTRTLFFESKSKHDVFVTRTRIMS